jgi:hypothetical protein
MWKRIFIMLTYTNMNMTRLWCKIVPKINVEHIKGNKGLFSYFYPFGDLVQGSFQGGFLRIFIIKCQL